MNSKKNQCKFLPGKYLWTIQYDNFDERIRHFCPKIFGLFCVRFSVCLRSCILSSNAFIKSKFDKVIKVHWSIHRSTYPGHNYGVQAIWFHHYELARNQYSIWSTSREASVSNLWKSFTPSFHFLSFNNRIQKENFSCVQLWLGYFKNVQNVNLRKATTNTNTTSSNKKGSSRSSIAILTFTLLLCLLGFLKIQGLLQQKNRITKNCLAMENQAW